MFNKMLSKIYAGLSGLAAVKEFIPYQCIRFDDSREDNLRLAAIASFVVSGGWSLYGEDSFINSLIKINPELAKIVITKTDLCGDGSVSLPRRIFICSLKCEGILRRCDEVHRSDPSIETETVACLQTVNPDLIPKEAYAARWSAVYPFRIPSIDVREGLDFLLLDLPASYSLFRVGFGYVHEILKRSGMLHQTIDLNIVLYHRYHMHKAMDLPGTLQTSSGYLLPDDPWGPLSVDEWCSSEMIEFFRPEIEELLADIERARPRMIGLSLHMGNRLFASEVVRGIRQRLPETLIVVGGFDCVHKELGPKIFPDFDFMVIGEAETSLSELLRRVRAGEMISDLPGIISRFDSSERVWQPGLLLDDLDSLPFPTYDWYDISLYRSKDGYYVGELAINRGCKWSRCTFCCECFPWRKRSAVNVVDEIEWFAKIGCRSIDFSVSDALGDSVTLLEIAKEINRRGVRCNILANMQGRRNILELLKNMYLGSRISINTQLRIDKRSDVDFFKILLRAGFKTMSFGVDGWTDRLLRMQNKGYNFDLVSRNLKAAAEAGIACSVNIVLGIPGETQEDVQESVRNIVSLKGAIHSVNSIYPLLLAPGSKYYQTPDSFNICFRGDREDIYNRYPYRIPAELWYSENPYIDQTVRLERISFLCQELASAGIKIDQHVLYMVNKFLNEPKAAFPHAESRSLS
jgi:radical SAM superfamily enzyme YgiQ (UPF0313 family)